MTKEKEEGGTALRERLQAGFPPLNAFDGRAKCPVIVSLGGLASLATAAVAGRTTRTGSIGSYPDR